MKATSTLSDSAAVATAAMANLTMKALSDSAAVATAANESAACAVQEVAGLTVDLPFTLQICGLCEHKSLVAATELYSPTRLVHMCKGFGIPPGLIFDLRVGKDLFKPDVQEGIWEYLRAQKPLFVVGSPPCSSSSVLQGLSCDSSKRRTALKEGVQHLEFCVRVYEFQLLHKRHFLHEHPYGVWSWDLPALKQLSAREGVVSTCVDQCMYGQWMHCQDGNWGRVQRPTRFLTSSSAVASRLGERCDGKHAHVQPLAGSARQTERYPPQLVHAILRGVRGQAELDGLVPVHSVGLTVEEPDVNPTPEDLQQEGGEFCDEITGLPLSTAGVRKARAEEMQYMKDLHVWDEVDESVALDRGFRVIGTRWLDINKGDSLQPVYRSRLVCQETRRVSSIRGDDISAVFAATPPLEALRW
eukprot:479773-Amphidinium_carterae.1